MAGNDGVLVGVERLEGGVATSDPHIVCDVELPNLGVIFVGHVFPPAILEVKEGRDAHRIEKLGSLVLEIASEAILVVTPHKNFVGGPKFIEFIEPLVDIGNLVLQLSGAARILGVVTDGIAIRNVADGYQMVGFEEVSHL